MTILSKAAEKNERFNFGALVGDVTCFFIGMAFLDSATALPALVEKLGGGATVVGVLLAVRQGAYFLPQLFVAHKLHNRTVYKPFLVKVAFWGRLGYWIAALVIWRFGASHPGLALGVFALAYAIAWTGDGAGGVPWTTLVGRMIAKKRRGRLFATTQILTGVARLAVGVAVVTLLGGKVAPFPSSLALLVGGCAFFLFVSWVFLALLREPEQVVATDEPAVDAVPFTVYLKQLPQKFKTRPDIGRLAVVQILGGASSAAAPFLTLAAGEKSLPLPTDLPLGLSHLLALLPAGGLPGLFLIAQTVGLLVTAPLWGLLTDKRGPRASLLFLIGLAFCAPLLSLWAIYGSGNLAVFLIAFAVFGAVMDGWVTITNYLLEGVGESEQAGFVGLLNAASAPILLIPLLCGLAYHRSGPVAAFGFAAGLLAVGWAFALSLPNTRKVTPRKSEAQTVS